MFLLNILYKITIVDTYKTMQVVYIGLFLLHDCMPVSIDGHISKGIACHEIKGTCMLN